MPNPLATALRFLRGDTLDSRAHQTLATLQQSPLEFKYAIQDFRAATTVNTLIHGPGATILAGRQAYDRLSNNSAVYACLRARLAGYLEAPVQVWEEQPGNQRTVLPDHPAGALLDRPNPYLTGRSLLWYLQWCKVLDGNAYVRKVRAGNGQPVELWPISPSRIEPKGDRDQFIAYYRYEYAPAKFEAIPAEDIIHFRVGMDDQDHLKGISELKRLLREVSADDAATSFSDELLHNYAMPGLVVSVEEGIDAEEAQRAKDRIASNFGPGNRGRVAVISGGATASAFSFSPRDLNLQELHRLPEERISAVIGVPAIVAGLGAGLDRSTYSNFREAREAFVEQTILPEYAADDEVWTLHLLTEFDSSPAHLVAHDISKMRALQEDTNALWARITLAFEKGLLDQPTALSELGYDVEQMQLQGEQGAEAALGKAVTRYLELKGSQSLDDLPGVLQAIVDVAAPGFTADLDRYQEGQRQRVIRRVVGQ